MKRDVKTVAGWDFERIIPCHGVGPLSLSSRHTTESTDAGRDREGREEGVDGGVQVVL